MTLSLSPWSATIPGSVGCWLYMDDRSRTGAGNDATEGMETALDNTAVFYKSVGFKERPGKLQIWSRAALKVVEHLGVMVVPIDSSADIVPRAGWDRIKTAIQVLATVPGSAGVREAAAATYIRPLWILAAPAFSPVPQDVPRMLFQAILRSKCACWCQGFW